MTSNLFVTKLNIYEIFINLPLVLEKLSSRVSHGRTRAETKRTFDRDCKNLKNRSTMKRKKPGSMMQA